MAMAFLFSACNKERDAVTPESESGYYKDNCVIVTKMIAGGGKYDESCTGIEVGTITAEEVDGNLIVTYNTAAPGWVMDVTHLYVGPEAGIPAGSSGNPKIGQFPYSTEHTGGVSTFAYTLPVPAGDYVVSAHAEVRYDPMLGFCAGLPETATISISNPGVLGIYEIIVSNAGDHNGTYQGWCVDIGHSIMETTYTADLYCTYGGLVPALTSGDNPHIDNPEKLPVVNWIINQGYIGQASQCGGTFTMGDVQMAIWAIIDNDEIPDNIAYIGDWAQCRVDEILQAVEDAGSQATSFVPTSGGYIAVAFAPRVDRQVIILVFTLTGEESEETAWGYGYSSVYGYCDNGSNGSVANGIAFTDAPDYGGSSWGWYFYGCADN